MKILNLFRSRQAKRNDKLINNLVEHIRCGNIHLTSGDARKAWIAREAAKHFYKIK